MRVPLSNDVIAYLASEVYDARDAKSISRAAIRGRQQADPAARYAHKADSLIAEIQTALREQGAPIDGDDLPDPVTLQYT
jgi:hypothetical protein